MPFQFRKEAIEEDLNSNFPSQGQGNPPLYYSLSEVVVPTYSINQVAEGSILPENLQTAWDFSTGHQSLTGTASSTLINNTGFWKVAIQIRFVSSGSAENLTLAISDGLSSKVVWEANEYVSGSQTGFTSNNELIVFLRSGDTFTESHVFSSSAADIEYRQIADLNGNLVNPLGFSAA